MNRIKSIDLFSGAGGLTIGLREAGIETICAVEFECFSAQTFSSHSPETDVILSDIKQVDLKRFQNQINLVCGGPPCQPFSSGGLRLSSEDNRNMIPWFIKAVDILRPQAFLMENVPGITVGNRRQYFDYLLNTFINLGYFISWKIINAANFGIPQIRRRLFIIGMREKPFDFPHETHGPNRELPFLRVKDVLPSNQIGEPNSSKIFYAKNPSLRPSPYHGHLFNGGGRPINFDQPAPTILASAGDNKTHFFDTLNLVPSYHRHLMEGGKPKKGELKGARRLTTLESAILQTFPTEITFCGPRSACYRQIGNAVPPLLAEVLGKALVSQLSRDKTYFTPYCSQLNSVKQGSLFPIETI